MHRVPESRVVRHWLALEREKRGLAPEPNPSGDSREALDRLLRYKPGAAAFIWRDAPVRWYRVTLSRAQFSDLRVVRGPPDLSWRALSPDGTVLGAARRLRAGDMDSDDPHVASIDVPYIDALRAAPPGTPLVLATRQGRVPWVVADGNHRAVAVALRLLDTGEFDPVDAYLGVGANPIFRPLRERALGLLDACRAKLQ